MNIKHVSLSLLLTCFWVANAQAFEDGFDVVPHDQPYFTKQVRNFELIYTEKNLDTAQHAAEVQLLLQPAYEEFFGYSLDEVMRIGLTSDYNQITNGFAINLPFVRQIYYGGGALLPNHFSSISWVDNLLYHETAHSFQSNAKNNPVSRSLHTVLKNGTLFLPWFILPNLVSSSFMLEGNAVLNEGWHGNGGRLFSGRFRAATLMQARAGLLTPERVYNDNLFFLYNSHFYTLGGFFNYYLAENYGLKTTNSYWLEHSRYWFWPFSTNSIARGVFDKDFETLVNEWGEQMMQEASGLTEAEGRIVAETQFYVPLNDDDSEIYFLVNKSGREYPDLVVLDKQTGKTDERVTTLPSGKLVRAKDGELRAQASAYINPWRVSIGLYDEGRYRQDGTASRVVEGYLADGRAVYFDVVHSWQEPHLFVDGEFYDTAQSTVFIKGNDIYYFKQKNKDRTLYRNREPLFTFKGYYGHPVGVNEKGIYFIANTEYGSGLYRYAKGQYERMSPADTIIDARLVDESTALVVSTGSDAYRLMLVDLAPQKQAPYEVSLLFEQQDYYKRANPDYTPVQDVPDIDLEDDYASVLDMHYAGTTLSLGNDSDAGFLYNISLDFADTLSMNAFSLFAERNLDEYGLAGLSYTNNQYFLNYRLSAYSVYERPERAPGAPAEKDKRDYGLVVNAGIPFLRTGYYFGSVDASYYEDYVSDSRKPLGYSLTLGNRKQFGVSMDSNFLLSLTAYGMQDRGDNTYGGAGIYRQGLPKEFFFAVSGQYSRTDADSAVDDRGVKIASSQRAVFEDSDLTTIVMPGIKNDPSYASEVLKYGMEIKKVFNFSAYYFTFPISLRREALYLGYNRYDITDFSGVDTAVNESVIGLELDTLWLNRFLIPVSLEYVHTDDETIANSDIFRVQLGIDF